MSTLGTFDGAMPATRVEAVDDWETTLHFDYERPPLTSNQRMHWRPRAALTADVRLAARLLAARIPALGKCRVTLTWYVTDKRRRDADNIVSTLKAMCDGLVDAGVVVDDTPDLMVKAMPEIVTLPKGSMASMELRIEMIR